MRISIILKSMDIVRQLSFFTTIGFVDSDRPKSLQDETGNITIAFDEGVACIDNEDEYTLFATLVIDSRDVCMQIASDLDKLGFTVEMHEFPKPVEVLAWDADGRLWQLWCPG